MRPAVRTFNFLSLIFLRRTVGQGPIQIMHEDDEEEPDVGSDEEYVASEQ